MAATFLAITRQLPKLENCSNLLKIQIILRYICFKIGKEKLIFVFFNENVISVCFTFFDDVISQPNEPVLSLKILWASRL